MSIWGRLAEIVSSAAAGALSTVIEQVRSLFEGDPETRRQVAFSIAMIALSAKMAKADGVVTADEVSAFQEIFRIPERDARHVARLYNLAKSDVAGFAVYAGHVRDLFPDDRAILEDVLDGLFHIAKADGMVHGKEEAFLEAVAGVFGFADPDWRRIRARHVAPGQGDPYLLLGASRDWDEATLRAHYRGLVRDNHPDKLIARGVPPEFVAIANDRLAQINRSWEQIRKERAL